MSEQVNKPTISAKPKTKQVKQVKQVKIKELCKPDFNRARERPGR